MFKEDLYSFYISQIQDNFVPYWFKFTDAEYGGIMNCINNYGDRRLSDNKFTWSQGRYLWVLSRLYDLNKMNVFPKISSEELRSQMTSTYEFIRDKSIYGDSICCYVLDRFGNKLKEERTGRYDASIFADSFASIGISQYIRVTGKKEKYPAARSLYDSMIKRLETGNFLTEPYPIPEGYVNHSIPMIMLNVTYEFIKMLESIGLPYDDEIARGKIYVDLILTRHFDDNLIREFVSTDENYEIRLLDRHINPGHTLEDMWFIIEFLAEFGDLERYKDQISSISKKTFKIGWDEEYGGLFRFIDKSGGFPQGLSGDSAYEKLILDTYDMKLWWPHSELLYLFLYLYEITGDEEMYRIYEKSHKYVFDTFPNDKIGEWIQIRKRDGTPEDKVVALPVKDPFHIMRNFIKIVELLGGK